MKKFTLIIIAIVIVALLIWLGMNLFNTKIVENNNPPNDEPSQEETEPTAKELLIQETTDTYTINVEYPEIKGTANLQAQIDANKLIKQITDAGIQGFKDDVGKDAVEDFSLKSNLKMSYEVMYLSDAAISIKFDINYYVAGAAHSTDYSSGFNYNLKDNKSMALGDLFNSDSDFLTTISTICFEDLKTQLKAAGYFDENTIKTGTESKEENFAEFVFDKDDVTIIFNVYQVAPYAAGTKLVIIPYTKLSKINNNELLKLIK